MRPSIRPLGPIALALLVGLCAGAMLGGPARPGPAAAGEMQADHAAKAMAKPGPKAPVEEVMHCPLAFAGVHLLKERPSESRVAYHYCKPVDAEVNQCVLYDGTGPDAKLIGVEYLVSDAIYRAMPDGEKSYWHDHQHEVDAGLLKSLTQSGAEEAATLAAVRPLWGKVFHTWVEGEKYPVGPPKLFWSATGQEPFVLRPGAALPVEVREKRPR